MLWSILTEAARNVRAHWLRVLLTSSGIAWGIALFIVMTAVGNASREHYRVKMEAIGRKAIYVWPGVVGRGELGERSTRRLELDVDDPPRLVGSPLVERAAPELWAGLRTLKGGGHIKVVFTYGVGAETAEIRNFAVARGRFITAADVSRRRRVLVLGAKVEQRLFGRGSALGRTIRLEGTPFRVVGVSVPKGEQMIQLGPRDDEQVLLPISTAQWLFTGEDEIDYVIYAPRTRADGPASEGRVRDLLGRHHGFTRADDDALSFFNVADVIRLMEGIETALQLFLVACGLCTLAAGGVGVMNIMLVAVAERTRELGLQKAIGASDRDLFVQLLGETVLVTVAAGVAGMLLGGAIVRFMGTIRGSSARVEFLVPKVTVSPTLAAVAFVVLVGVGVLAGLVPARRASRLDPAVALREE